MFYVKMAIMLIVGSVWNFLIGVIDILTFVLLAINKAVRELCFMFERLMWGKDIADGSKAWAHYQISTVYTAVVDKMYPNEEQES